MRLGPEVGIQRAELREHSACALGREFGKHAQLINLGVEPRFGARRKSAHQRSQQIGCAIKAPRRLGEQRTCAQQRSVVGTLLQLNLDELKTEHRLIAIAIGAHEFCACIKHDGGNLRERRRIGRAWLHRHRDSTSTRKDRIARAQDAGDIRAAFRRIGWNRAALGLGAADRQTQPRIGPQFGGRGLLERRKRWLDISPAVGEHRQLQSTIGDLLLGLAKVKLPCSRRFF